MDFINVLPELLYETKDKSALAHDILSMRKRMEEEIGKESAASYNIKQGTGGLVDIEFIVQFLQLLHGKQHPWVRVPGTYDALRALWKEKLLAADDYRILRRAYDFIRQLESRLRIVSNQATNTLSKDPNKLRFLARRMGYTDDGSLAGQHLLKDYNALNQQVHLLFDKLLHQT
jgi:glutamate-ammonia-ligase adenylyltransferase